MGRFEVIDLENKGKKPQFQYFDEKGQENSFELGKELDEFVKKYDKLKEELRETLKQNYYRNLTEIVEKNLQDSKSLKEQILSQAN